MKFCKVHGLGNDFVLFDGRGVERIDWKALTVRACDRHTGVGADGALILLRSAIADVRMRSINADGSEAEMSGNGIRAFSRYCFENGVVRGMEFSVETGAGVIRSRILLKGGRVDGVRVDMGKPQLDAKDVPVLVEGRAIDRLLTVSGRTFPFSSVRVGVPHTIIFDDSLSESEISEYGPLIERDRLFPERTNVDFVENLSESRIRVRSWKRGCGRTLASGTGACAAAVVSALSGKTGRSVTVEFPLGTLLIEWDETDDHVRMTGPAEIALSGVWNG